MSNAGRHPLPLLVEVSPGASHHLAPHTRTAVLMAGLAIVLTAFLGLYRVPYAIYQPGPATNVLGNVDGVPLLRIEGTRSYRPSPNSRGTLDMTTVSVSGGPEYPTHLDDVLRAWVSPDDTVLPREQVFPKDQSAQAVRQENAAEMSQSQEQATVAGLREAGRVVREQVRVISVDPKAPAAAVLKAGDVLTDLQGRPVTGNLQMRSTLTALRPGAAVRLVVRRGGSSVALRTKTTNNGDRTVLGVDIEPVYDFPVTVKFATKDVGGPSAGMMFALGIYDLLTPGDLVGEQPIAGTGTIDPEGQVGPIGGIAQKLVGAKAAGAKWFLAPQSNCSEVVGHVPQGLRVVSTSTLHESRLAVQKIAAGQGASLPTCTR